MRKWIALALASLALFASLSAFAAEGETITIPAGTLLEVRLMTALSTKASQEGDPFSGRIVEPIFIGGEEVLPAGSTLEGRVTYVKDPGHVKGKAEMRLLAESITTPQDVNQLLNQFKQTQKLMKQVASGQGLKGLGGLFR